MYMYSVAYTVYMYIMGTWGQKVIQRCPLRVYTVKNVIGTLQVHVHVGSVCCTPSTTHYSLS